MSRSVLFSLLGLGVLFGAIHFALTDWYLGRAMGGGVAERTLEQFDAAGPEIDVLALGGSHVKWGVRPEFIPGAFNFAMPGERYIYTYYRLRSLLEAGLDVRAVIISADPHALLEHTRDPGFQHYYAWFVDFPALGWAEGEPLLYTARWLRDRYAPYAGKRRYVLDYLADGRPPELPWLENVAMEQGAMLGTRSLADRMPAEIEAAARERAELHFGKPTLSLASARHLERLLELCEREGIEVLLVRFPLTPAYREALAAHVDEAVLDARLAKIAAPFRGIRTLDFRARFDDHPGLFSDVDHVNERGAVLLSQAIRRALEK